MERTSVNGSPRYSQPSTDVAVVPGVATATRAHRGSPVVPS